MIMMVMMMMMMMMMIIIIIYYVRSHYKNLQCITEFMLQINSSYYTEGVFMSSGKFTVRFLMRI